MSTQEIQHLYKLLSDLKAQVSGFIGRSDTKHQHFDDHIKGSEKRQERIESQLNAIANALLQEQTRDNVEKEVEEKTGQQEEKSEEQSSNKNLLWQTTIVLAIFSVLSNLGEIFGFLAKIFSLLAG